MSGQVDINRNLNRNINNTIDEDSTSKKRSNGFKNKANIDMYLMFTEKQDTTSVDTTLTIKKDYKYNYLQKDNFGLMPFSNIGQTYNALTYNFNSKNSIPLFGARARHYNYYEENNISYYEVPTPWTRLTYKTAFEQGQMLDAFFTVNLSKQFNFSIAYKGLRSLGNYQNSLTSTGNFRFTSNYQSKNKVYEAKVHIVMQDLLNQENGGLQNEDIPNFENGNEEFSDRSVFDPNLENAENILEGKRFYINHSFKIINKKDSSSTNQLSVINKTVLEDKFYQFNQTTPTESFFGNSFNNRINDRVTLENFNTQLGLNYKNNFLGDITFGLGYNNINYGYDTVVIAQDQNIPNRIKIDFLALHGHYKKQYKGFIIEGSGSLNISKDFAGNNIGGNIQLKLLEDLNFKGGININSRLPNFNHLLYQSDYTRYNWYNFNDFKNINTQQISVSIESSKYINIDLDISNIRNHTYFNLESSLVDKDRVVRPTQYDKAIQYVRLKVGKEFRLGNFALDNTVMYQNLISDDNVINVPEIITRNTLYYSNEIFKKAMKLQTGITLNYFTKYNMDGYDPLLAEFYTQNETQFGGFPRLDFFINAKIRQTRIFFKAEHFNSSLTGFNYFSAPNVPFRDFAIRFGLVWDFFL
ncbi:putative porin [uncultured Winogradskyella sp.]|uniref:putative porin n=1 Tax=uncultured Winogradskyella sp. TaxID=395353 RepID=UPI00262E23F5|nr:putative porin [uncultured Winogradskyella sp.]